MNYRRRRRRHGAGNSSLRPDFSYRAALDSIALSRRNPRMPLEQAARLSGTTVASVRRHAASALTYRAGRWQAKAYDTLPRAMRFLTERGYVKVTTRDSHDASLIGEYNNAIRDYLQPPHPTKGLKEFEGESIISDGREYVFVTDPGTINRLARAGVIYFMDLYADGGP